MGQELWAPEPTKAQQSAIQAAMKDPANYTQVRKPKPVQKFSPKAPGALALPGQPVNESGIASINAEMAADPAKYEGLRNYRPLTPPTVSQYGAMNIPGDPTTTYNRDIEYGQSDTQGSSSDPFKSGYGIAYGEMPGEDTPWLQSQLEQNRLGAESAYDRMSRGAASGLGTGMSGLARAGGLGSGARERLAGQSAYQQMMGGQGIGMQQSQRAQDLKGQDYMQRVERGKYEDRMRMADDYAKAMGESQPGQGNIERGVQNIVGTFSDPAGSIGGFWDRLKRPKG